MVSCVVGCPILSYLSYLPDNQRTDVINLLHTHLTLFSDVPFRNNVLEHDIEVGSAAPIKQHACRCPVEKRQVMKRETEYLLENGLAKLSHSP